MPADHDPLREVSNLLWEEAPTVSWKVENTCVWPKISYIDILLEEWNQMSGIEQHFENQKL